MRLLGFIVYCLAIAAAGGTEFGGMVGGRLSPEKLLEWKNSSSMSWIRTTSAELAQTGLSQVAVVNYAPADARRDGGKQLPDDLLALYWHCRTNLPLYPNILQAWEIWNEPDFHFVSENPDRMAAVMKAAYWGVKAGNPNALVLMPSLAFAPDKYPRELARNNAFAYTDGYNFHYYGWAHDFLPMIAQHRKFMQDQGLNLPLWITEAGFFQMRREVADSPLELARQQTFHERMVISAFAAGIDYYLPFILTPYQEEGFDHSLTHDDLSPRPALESYLALTRLLSATKPRYAIWHRALSCEIGVVLEQSDGRWWTILWSPHRLRDFSLPTEKPGTTITREKPSGSPDQNSDTDSTDFEVKLRLPPTFSMLQLGLTPGLAFPNPVEASFTVNAEHNLHLRTAPVPFEIQGCDWKTIVKFKAESRKQKAEITNSKVENRKLKAEIKAPLSYDHRSADSLSHGLFGGTPTNARETRAVPNPQSAIRNPQFQTAPPSPVVVQVNYDRFTVTAHKPSQTYRFNPSLPVLVEVRLYNFSSESQTGVLIQRTGEGPKKPVAGRSEVSREWEKSLIPNTQEQKWRLESRRSVALAASDYRITLPPYGKTNIAIRLDPIAIHGVINQRRRVRGPGLQGLVGRVPSRGGTSVAVYSQSEPSSGTSRFPVSFLWIGRDGLTDVAASWLEPEEKNESSPYALPLTDWQPTPDYPHQWTLERMDSDRLRLTLKELPPSGRMASIFCLLKTPAKNPLSHGTEDRLTPDTVIQFDLRATIGSHSAFYRINLITPEKEVFRYMEDQPFGNHWQRIRFRLGDLGPTFWSRASGNYAVPADRLRFLRLSLSGLLEGDAVEVREAMIRSR